MIMENKYYTAKRMVTTVDIEWLINDLLRSLYFTERAINGAQLVMMTRSNTRTVDIFDRANTKEVAFGEDNHFYCPACRKRLDAGATMLCMNCFQPIRWSCSDMNESGANNLASAILENAVSDYQLACQFKNLFSNDSVPAHIRKKQVERFFGSNLFDALCPNLDGKELFEKLKKKCEKEKDDLI